MSPSPNSSPATDPALSAPVSARAALIGIGTIVAGTAAQLIPPHYVMYATSVAGICAWIAASWRPAPGSSLAYVWILFDVIGANVGFARNAAPPLPLPSDTK